MMETLLVPDDLDGHGLAYPVVEALRQIPYNNK